MKCHPELKLLCNRAFLPIHIKSASFGLQRVECHQQLQLSQQYRSPHLIGYFLLAGTSNREHVTFSKLGQIGEDGEVASTQ